MTASSRAERTAEADVLCAEAYDACGAPDLRLRPGGRRRLRPRRARAVLRPRRGPGDRPGRAGGRRLGGEALVPAVGLRRPAGPLGAVLRRDGLRRHRRPAGGARPARRPARRRRPAPHAAAAHHDARGVAARRAGPAARAPHAGSVAPRPHRGAGARARCRTSRRPRAGCATPPCSRRWWPAGWSTYPTSRSSAAGSHSSTCATRSTTSPAGPPTGWAPRSGNRPGRGPRPARRPGRTARGPRAGPPDHAPVAADLARVDAVLAPPGSPTGARRPVLTTLAPGVALSGGEVVLDSGARPERDPCCCSAPPRRPPSATSCCPRRPPPGWCGTAAPCRSRGHARHATCWCGCSRPGRGLLGVWETLEETGALARILPEWERIRLLPHASVIHRFTVDRHVVETCIEASALIRQVARPDVLMVAALLHDIGKGGLTEHSVAGEPIARAIATRMGFEADAVDLIATLVRRHLLLAQIATTPRPRRPRHRRGDHRADHQPRGAVPARRRCPRPTPGPPPPQAWSSWRAGLIRDPRPAGPGGPGGAGRRRVRHRGSSRPSCRCRRP